MSGCISHSWAEPFAGLSSGGLGEPRSPAWVWGSGGAQRLCVNLGQILRVVPLWSSETPLGPHDSSLTHHEEL